MTNMEKYEKAFIDAFEADPEKVHQFVFRETEAWDSIGHMALIASLEDEFGIEFEPEEMMNIVSFDAGIEVLKSKGIQI